MAGGSDALTFQVEGARELRRALRGMTDELRDLSRVHKQIAEIVRGQMASAAPRETGTLAGSLRASGTRTRARVQSTLIYAPIIHYGWPGRNIRPSLFGDHAREAAAPQIESAYRAGIDAIVRNAGGP